MPRYMQISISERSTELLKSLVKPAEIEHTFINGRGIYYITLPHLKDYQALEEICHENAVLTFFVDSDN